MLHYTFTKQEAKPVTSPLIEVRETYTGPYTTPDPIVKEVDIEHIEDSDVEGSEQQKGKIYKTKKEFVDEMTNAYTKELLNKGLDPMFAKYLVAQDGLESNWGKSSLGYHFNYGGIKEIRPGKGVAKPTNEFINGKMEKVSGNFREFASLQDYVKYKVGLLNNSRYRAFSSHPGDFIFRVVGGGYATDPEYVNKFNRHLNSFQKGGVLQKRKDIPAEVEARKWANAYIRANKDKFAENMKSNHWLLSLIPTKLLGNFIANYYTERIDNIPTKVDDAKLSSNEAAAYYPNRGIIYISDAYKDDVSTHVHEKRHIINQIGVDTLKEYIKKVGGNIFIPGVKDAKFNPEEALAEAAEIKMHYPHDHVYTKEELQQIQNRGNNGYVLVQPSGFLGEVYEFTPDKTVRNRKPISIKDGEGVVIRKSHPSYSGLTDLNLETLDQIFNKIAHNSDNKKESEKDIIYGKGGIKMSGIPYANLIDDSAERYNYSVNGTYDPETTHYSSRDPKTGLILKGVGHPTRRLAFEEDKEGGYDWYEGYDGNTYSYDLFEAAGKPVFNIPMKEHQVVTGKKSNLTLYDLHNLIDKYKNKHKGVWTDEDVKYFYDKIQTSGFLPEAIAYVTATESSFNPNAKSSESTAAGLGQLTNARMKQLLGNNYKEARQQYNNGTRSIKDQIDDLMLNIAQIDGSIKDSFDNFGYGRLKMNYLKPSWSVNRPTLEGLDLEKNLTKDQRTRITEKSSVRDLIEEYDNEFTKNFGYASK